MLLMYVFRVLVGMLSSLMRSSCLFYFICLTACYVDIKKEKIVSVDYGKRDNHQKPGIFYPAGYIKVSTFYPVAFPEH